MHEASALHTYTAALYWAVTTMATVGYGDIVAQGLMRRWYAIGVMLLGVGTFGYIIGNIASLLANIDRIGAAQRAKLEGIRQHMRYHHFPRPLQAKIEEYYRYMFDHRIGQENEQFLHELPYSLRAEVGVHMHRDVLGKVPFLQNADAKVLERLVFRLHPQLLRPQDTVFRKGDSGDRMYFIKRGTIEIYTSDKEHPIAQLQEGSFFGEAALLGSARRNATAKASGFCELVYLDKAALEETTRRYPDFAEEIRRIAQSRTPPVPGGA